MLSCTNRPLFTPQAGPCAFRVPCHFVSSQPDRRHRKFPLVWFLQAPKSMRGDRQTGRRGGTALGWSREGGARARQSRKHPHIRRSSSCPHWVLCSIYDTPEIYETAGRCVQLEALHRSWWRKQQCERGSQQSAGRRKSPRGGTLRLYGVPKPPVALRLQGYEVRRALQEGWCESWCVSCPGPLAPCELHQPGSQH